LYLSQYGYLAPSRGTSGQLLDERTYRKAIEDFQAFAGLNVTVDFGKTELRTLTRGPGTWLKSTGREKAPHGRKVLTQIVLMCEVDPTTLEAMSLPRCGVKDKVGTGDNRAKRYALQGSRWKVKDLTYKISKYPAKLKRADVDKEIQRAFNVWSEHTDLTFKPKAVRCTLKSDSKPESTVTVTRSTDLVVFGGDAHFDASENWSINSYRGTNLFQVAAHEFGHSLGLSHSDVRQALMAPFYRGYDPVFNLDTDDVEGIQALYGKKTKTSKPFYGDDDDDDFADQDGNFDESHNSGRRTPAPTQPDKSLCQDAKFDTIFNSPEGHTYVFKGQKYWRLTEESVAAGYPKLISEGWPGLPGNLDAAFTYKNGKTYFFKGSKYWRKMDGVYPKEISEGFTGIPDDLDAALVWSGNGKIYFYKGSKFWRFDPSQRPPVKSTYPKPISNWEGVPDNLGAAFQWTNGYTYFYKDNAYYRFNDRAFAVDVTNPPFPRSTAYWWFGCKESPAGTIGTSESRGWLVGEESSKSPFDDTLHSDDVMNDDTGDIQEQTPSSLSSNEAQNSSSRIARPLTLTILVTLTAAFLTSVL
ncbi:hypothetical protein NQ317_008873, partial [Molorchus minor]